MPSYPRRVEFASAQQQKHKLSLTYTHLFVMAAGGVRWRCTITRYPSILLCGNAGVR